MDRNRMTPFIHSVLILVAVFIITSLAMSSFIPQGLTPEEYTSLFGKFGTDFIFFCGFNHFHTSFMFISLVVTALCFLLIKFSMNSPSNSLLLLSVILTIIFIMMNKAGRKEIAFTVREGETFNIKEIIGEGVNDRIMKLHRFEIKYYPGKKIPEEYISKLVVSEKDTIQIRVNSPYELGSFKIYQDSYEIETAYDIALNNKKRTLFANDTLMIQGKRYSIKEDPVTGKIFINIDDESYPLNNDGNQEGMFFDEIKKRKLYASVFKAVKSPYRYPLLSSALLYLLCLIFQTMKKESD